MLWNERRKYRTGSKAQSAAFYNMYPCKYSILHKKKLIRNEWYESNVSDSNVNNISINCRTTDRIQMWWKLYGKCEPYFSYHKFYFTHKYFDIHNLFKTIIMNNRNQLPPISIMKQQSQCSKFIFTEPIKMYLAKSIC